jgi:hypothetical protein
MKYTAILATLIAVLLAACASPAEPPPASLSPSQPSPATESTTTPMLEASSTAPPPTQAASATATHTLAEGQSYTGLPLPLDKDEHFAGSGTCAVCHTNMIGPSGADVSIDRQWKASLMANSARDPYWLASVRHEVLSAPDLADIIDDKCASCHMPMAATAAHLAGGTAKIFDGGLADPANPGYNLALDGVSCNLCHQVQPENFGQTESFSGSYLIDETTPMGQRPSFGPFQVDDPLAQAMAAVSGYLPVQAEHIRQAEMCATCHTLYTPYLDADGQVVGQFPEQTPYLEWLNSAYPSNQSCSDCHMPSIPGEIQLAINGGPPRSGARQHTFMGGNAYMGRILSAFGDDLALAASSQEMQAMIAATENNLFSDYSQDSERPQTQKTAFLELLDLKVDGTTLVGRVVVQSQTGHKFPTSFPSRRAWLHLAVSDADGKVVFESGAVSAEGAIQGNDNDADPASYEPHYQVLSSPDQVQIYETILGNTDDEVTTTLLRASQYLKDNRLLPAGFDKDGAPADIAVYGEVTQDGDFTAGSDTLLLSIGLGDAQGPFAVQAELLYQSIGYRWAMNLGEFSAPEIDRFIGYYNAVPNLPALIHQVIVKFAPY